MEILAVTLLSVFLAIFLASLGGRDQILVASLSDRLGAGPGLVLASAIATGVSTGGLGWLGWQTTNALGQDHRSYAIGLAIIVAALLMVLPARLTLPKEPTRSVGAITIVLIMRQMLDAPRMLTFAAFAYASASALLVVAAFSGSMLALVLGMASGTTLQQWPHWHLLRITLAIVLLAGATLVAFID